MSVHHVLVLRSRSLGKGREAEGGCGNEASALATGYQNTTATVLRPHGNCEDTHQSPEEPQVAAVFSNGRGKSLIADDALQRQEKSPQCIQHCLYMTR